MEAYKNTVIGLAIDALETIINCEQKRKIFYKKRKIGEIANSKLFVDFAMKGKKYSQSNPIRFMMVGRAAGCFNEDNNFNVINFANRDNISINRDAVNLCFEDAIKNEMKWISEKPVTEKGEHKKRTDRKAFFGFAKMVYLKLTEQAENEDWYKNIVRTNLFKIIPLSGGNPSCYLRKTQINLSIEILKAEIEFYKPTHILIIDGKDNFSWITDYKDSITESAKKIGAKVCFVDRPETRKKEKLLETIDEDFWITS